MGTIGRSNVHGKGGVRFKTGWTYSREKSRLRNVISQRIVTGHVEVTLAVAKRAQQDAERLVTYAKKGDLAARRRAAAFMMDVVADVKEDGDKVVVQTALQKLFDDVAPRYAERNGGYTRILKMEQRRGDAAKMVVLELV